MAVSFDREYPCFLHGNSETKFIDRHIKLDKSTSCTMFIVNGVAHRKLIAARRDVIDNILDEKGKKKASSMTLSQVRPVLDANMVGTPGPRAPRKKVAGAIPAGRERKETSTSNHERVPVHEQHLTLTLSVGDKRVTVDCNSTKQVIDILKNL